MTIRCIYQAVPNFPATDQHPDAVRYGPLDVAGKAYYVDAIGGAPSEAEILAVIDPPSPVPTTISDRQFTHALKLAGAITHAEAMAFVQTGTIPAALQAVVDGIGDQQQREAAELLLAGATSFEREHPMTLALAAGMDWSAAQVDALWIAAAQL